MLKLNHAPSIAEYHLQNSLIVLVSIIRDLTSQVFHNNHRRTEPRIVRNQVVEDRHSADPHSRGIGAKDTLHKDVDITGDAPVRNKTAHKLYIPR